jgi:ribonuclease HI
MITIYTDGSYRKKISAASSAMLVVFPDGKLYTEHKYLGNKTNNYAELFAVKMALSWCFKQKLLNEQILICSDSTYAIGISSGKMTPKANKELAEVANHLYECFSNIKIEWVKSHSTNKYNKLVDTIANIAIDQHHNMTQEY